MSVWTVLGAVWAVSGLLVAWFFYSSMRAQRRGP
jgi:hypothetical protein